MADARAVRGSVIHRTSPRREHSPGYPAVRVIEECPRFAPRGHWSIENRSHYVRDVTLGEDASRIRKGCGPEIMAALRNAAIGFLRATGATISPRPYGGTLLRSESSSPNWASSRSKGPSA